MGDVFNQSLTIVKVPGPPEPPINSADALEITDPLERIADLLEAMAWGVEWISPRILDSRFNWSAGKVRSVIEDGETFTVDDGRHDELEKLGEILTEAGFSWYGIVHPKYEYPGDYHAYTPELGAFQGTCDDDGNVYVTTHDLMALIDAATTLEELRERVAVYTGKPWHDAFHPPENTETP